MKYLGVLLLFFIISSVSAIDSLSDVEINNCVELSQTCGNCTFVNITSVRYPNSSIALSDVEMTKSGTEYNYTFCNTSVLGEYLVSGFGDIDGSNEVFHYTFDIVPSDGVSDDLGRSLIISLSILVVFGIAVLFFLGFLFYKRNNDEAGLESGDYQVPWRWTFFLLTIMFIMFAINIAALSISNYIGEADIARLFDRLGSLFYYMYWFIGGLMLMMWVLSFLASAANKRNMKRAEQIGQPWSPS